MEEFGGPAGCIVKRLVLQNGLVETLPKIGYSVFRH